MFLLLTSCVLFAKSSLSLSNLLFEDDFFNCLFVFFGWPEPFLLYRSCSSSVESISMSSELSFSSSHNRSSLSFVLLFVSWFNLASSNSCSCKVLMLFSFVVLSCMGVVCEMRFVGFPVDIVCSGDEIVLD